MFKDYLKLAWENITHRKIRSWLTIIGIVIGIAAVVALISLGAGLKLAVANQFNILGAERITIQAKGLQNGPPGTSVANPLTTQDLKLIQNTAGVEVAAGRIIQTSIVEVKKKTYITYIGSIPENPAEREWINEVGNIEIEHGRALTPSDRYKITIGNDYHEKQRFGVNLNVGDKITIQGKEFEVVGIHEKKGAFTVDGIISMNEKVVREIYENSDRHSIIVAKANNINDIDRVSDNIKKELRRSRSLKEGKEDFSVETNQQAFSSISNILNIVTVLLTGIASISLVVGGVGILNTMYTAILERRREIGIMKAIGAKNSDIFTLFFIESGIIGLIGGIVGIILGIILAKIVELIGQAALGTSLLQATFSPTLLIGALLFSFIVGSIAGTSPALGAAKMNPVDALRS
jgi:putative ABC transport system permease protein